MVNLVNIKLWALDETLDSSSSIGSISFSWNWWKSPSISPKCEWLKFYIYNALCQKSPQKAFIRVKMFRLGLLEIAPVCHKLPIAYNVKMWRWNCSWDRLNALLFVIQLCQVWPHLKLDSSWRSLRACVLCSEWMHILMIGHQRLSEAKTEAQNLQGAVAATDCGLLLSLP